MYVNKLYRSVCAIYEAKLLIKASGTCHSIVKFHKQKYRRCFQTKRPSAMLADVQARKLSIYGDSVYVRDLDINCTSSQPSMVGRVGETIIPKHFRNK